MASPVVVKINDVDYAVQVDPKTQRAFQRLRNDDYIQQFSEGGLRSPSIAKDPLSITFPNFIDGLGRERIDSDSAAALKLSEYRRFFDATADTRFASGQYAPILEQNATHAGLEVMRAWAAFKGNIFSIWEDDTSTDIVSRVFVGSTDTWDNGGDVVAGATTLVARDIIATKTNLIVLYAVSDEHEIARSTDGATWTSTAATPPTADLLSDNVGANENIDIGLLSEIGGEAVAVLWHEANGTITFFSSTDAGAVWGDEAIDIPTGNGPQGVAVLAGIDNEDKLYVGTREGLYEVDTAPSTWTTRLIFPMVANKNNCRRMKVMQDGALWFSAGVSEDAPPIVYRMFVGNGERIIERVPNDFGLGDGLSAEASGPILWMEPAEGMVYAAAGGGKAGRKARIWCHNGRGWHSVRKHGTANETIQLLAVSADDDATPRLHYAFLSSGVSNAKFLEQPFVNPASGVTIQREPTGYIDLPFIDGGSPLDDKNWLRIGVNASNLDSADTADHIEIYYGITTNLGSPVARDYANLGDILSGTSRLPIGTNGIGEVGRFLGLRATINVPGTNTEKPTLKDIQIEFIPKPDVTMMNIFVVDIKESAVLAGGENATKAVYDSLDALQALKVKARVDIADEAARYMNVVSVNFPVVEVFSHEHTGSVDPNARKQGTATITLGEVAS